MLVLSRKRDESIVCGELEGAVINLPGPIVITVVEIRGDKVRLGIEASRKVPVHRLEVALAIQREREPHATQPEPTPVPAA